MSEEQTAFGLMIRARRKEKKMSLREAASELECSHVYLSEIERGKKRPSFMLAFNLARVLDIPMKRMNEEAAELHTTPRSLRARALRLETAMHSLRESMKAVERQANGLATQLQEALNRIERLEEEESETTSETGNRQ